MSSSEAVKRASRVYRSKHQEKVSAYNKHYGELNIRILVLKAGTLTFMLVYRRSN